MKKKINIGPLDFKKEIEYEGEQFDVYSIDYDGKKSEGIKFKKESIILFPFDINEQSQVRRVYIKHFYNFVDEEAQFCALSRDFDEEEDDSLFDTVKKCALEDLGITESQVKINDIYLLGQILVNRGLNEKIHCYAYNVTDLSTSPGGFEAKIHEPREDYIIEAANFRDVLKGSINETLIMSSSFLLLSYFS